MKFFFWNLNAKEKFIRVFWTGLLALIILYAVVWYYAIDFTVPIILTVLYIIDLGIRYKKIHLRNEHS